MGFLFLSIGPSFLYVISWQDDLKEANLWQKTINNTLLSLLHMISFNLSLVLSYNIFIYK